VGQIGDKKAIRPLEQTSSSDSESFVRDAAKEALRKIKGETITIRPKASHKTSGKARGLMGEPP
jgi:HEAT repeat protein